jgi:hypothetical protein
LVKLTVKIEVLAVTVKFPDVAVATTLSAAPGTTPPTQLGVAFQLPPVLLIVIVAIY